jgi:hypothetical protein
MVPWRGFLRSKERVVKTKEELCALAHSALRERSERPVSGVFNRKVRPTICFYMFFLFICT